MKTKTYFLAVFILTMSALSFVSCDSTNTNNKSSSVTETFEAGEFAYLTDNCIGVVDTDDMSIIMDFLRANDMTGIQQMVAAGKQVKVIKIGFEYIQVRDVDASEMLVWLPKNMLTHEDVYGIYTPINK